MSGLGSAPKCIVTADSPSGTFAIPSRPCSAACAVGDGGATTSLRLVIYSYSVDCLKFGTKAMKDDRMSNTGHRADKRYYRLRRTPLLLPTACCDDSPACVYACLRGGHQSQDLLPRLRPVHRDIIILWMGLECNVTTTPSDTDRLAWSACTAPSRSCRQADPGIQRRRA